METLSVDEHLQGLNPEQLRAVETINGPLLVLAGAGSGKTRVLTRRIAHLLHHGVLPHNILAVTFTNKAATEMKQRVEELVGEQAQKVWVSTFHSSCARILRADIESLGWTRRFSIYDSDDQVRVVRGILKDIGIERATLSPKAVLSQIDRYKNRMLTPHDLLKEVRFHENDPLYQVWRSYEEQLKAADAVDFTDLIGLTVRLFIEHPSVLARWQERFQYLLVDEYQDTNRAQYLLLRALAQTHRNVAVVGDDDQSIYGFRGADVSNILGFQEDYPEACVIRLEQNYRSKGNILKTANAVVKQNVDRIDKELWTEAEPGPLVNLLVSASPRDEALRVARAVGKLHRVAGYNYEDIAIIYRTNATSRPFEQALRMAGIPHRLVGGRKFYERREVRDVLAYMRLVVNPADDAAFLRVVNVPSRGVGAKTLERLRQQATERGEPLLKTARMMAAGVSRAAKGLKSFVDIIDELIVATRRSPPAELVIFALECTGYKVMLETDETEEAAGRLDNLKELVRDALSYAPASDSVGPVEQLQAWLDRIALTGQDEDIPDGGEVTLMTVHNAKGLEFPVVFVVHVMEGQFPHSRCGPTEVDEERRLAYVAFTRAQERLIITRSKTQFFTTRQTQRMTNVAPSRFLFNLPPDACEGELPSNEPAFALDSGRRWGLSEQHKEQLRTYVEYLPGALEDDGFEGLS